MLHPVQALLLYLSLSVGQMQVADADLDGVDDGREEEQRRLLRTFPDGEVIRILSEPVHSAGFRSYNLTYSVKSGITLAIASVLANMQEVELILNFISLDVYSDDDEDRKLGLSDPLVSSINLTSISYATPLQPALINSTDRESGVRVESQALSSFDFQVGLEIYETYAVAGGLLLPPSEALISFRVGRLPALPGPSLVALQILLRTQGPVLTTLERDAEISARLDSARAFYSWGETAVVDGRQEEVTFRLTFPEGGFRLLTAHPAGSQMSYSGRLGLDLRLPYVLRPEAYLTSLLAATGLTLVYVLGGRGAHRLRDVLTRGRLRGSSGRLLRG